MRRRQRAAGARDRKRIRVWVLGAALAVLALALYARVQDHGFVGYDDPEYVTEDPRIHQGLSGPAVAWAFTTTKVGNWHPLTLISHMLDCHLFGLRPSGHHLVNVGLHAANTALLFEWLLAMTGAPLRAGAVAALFAVHPLNVESVAWVSSRKNVLSTLFWLLTCRLWVHHARGGGRRAYAAALVTFLLGLLAKPMLVTLPLVLVLVDLWPLGRLRAAPPPGARQRPPAGGETLGQLVREKLPFLALALGSAFMTLRAQQLTSAVGSLETFPLSVRLANAVVSYAAYLGQAVWPAHLAVFYPHPGGSLPAWQIALSAALLGVASGLAWRERARRPHLAFGWAWYLITLLPVIGLVQVGEQARADRYAYVPLVGPFVAVTWLAAEWKGRAARIGLSALAALAIGALAVRTWVHLPVWRNSESLFRSALAHTERNYLAHGHLGATLLESGRLDEAAEHFHRALAIRPDHFDAHNNLGVVMMEKGRFEEAAAHFRRALALQPGRALTHEALGHVYERQGLREEALASYRRSLEHATDEVRAARTRRRIEGLEARGSASRR